MRDKFFLDTNIFLYHFDKKNSPKRRISDQLIKKAHFGEGIISYQVIQEYLNVATKKFSTSMTTIEASRYFNTVLFPICEIFPNKNLFDLALEVKERWQLSFYDSLIVAAALEGNCKTLYSEDLQHNQKIYELTIVNPYL